MKLDSIDTRQQSGHYLVLTIQNLELIYFRKAALTVPFKIRWPDVIFNYPTQDPSLSISILNDILQSTSRQDLAHKFRPC